MNLYRRLVSSLGRIRRLLGILPGRVASRSRLLLHLAQLSLVLDIRALGVGKTRADEEEEVDDGQDPMIHISRRLIGKSQRKKGGSLPNHGSKSGATGQGAAFVLGVAGRTGAGPEEAVAREPDRGRGSGPCPGAEPEDDAEDVGDQGDDAVEDVRGPDLDGCGAADDDEGLDCLKGWMLRTVCN